MPDKWYYLDIFYASHQFVSLNAAVRPEEKQPLIIQIFSEYLRPLLKKKKKSLEFESK